MRSILEAPIPEKPQLIAVNPTLQCDLCHTWSSLLIIIALGTTITQTWHWDQTFCWWSAARRRWLFDWLRRHKYLTCSRYEISPSGSRGPSAWIQYSFPMQGKPDVTWSPYQVGDTRIIAGSYPCTTRCGNSLTSTSALPPIYSHVNKRQHHLPMVY